MHTHPLPVVACLLSIGWASHSTLATEPARVPVPTAQGVSWQSDLETAHRASLEHRKPILIVFGAEWCGYCHKLERETFRHPELAHYINTYFVPLHLDFDQERELARRLGVESLPASVVITSQGELLGRFIGFQEPIPYYRSLYQAQETEIRLRERQAVQPTTGTR